MPKTGSLLSILLLSSALLTTGCNNTSSPSRNADPDLVPNGGGRAGVMNIDQRTTDQRNANQTAQQTGDLPGGSTDQARLSALGQNARVDNNLSARVGRIHGIRSAKVLVTGDSAFVMVNTRGNQGTSEPSRPRTAGTDRGTDPGRDPNPRADVKSSIQRQQGVRTNDTGNSTIYFADTLESDVKARVSDEIIRANPAIRNVYFVNKWR